MACNTCTKKFGLFLKENGCPSCKYTFCSKCLKYRIKIDSKNKDVCLRCFELSKSGNLKNINCCSNTSSSVKSILDVPVELPSAKVDLIRPVSPSAQVTAQHDDTLIQERLTALKRKDDDGENQHDLAVKDDNTLIGIEKRLALLKGVEYKDYKEANKKFLLQKDKRSEEEQIRDLMTQFAEEQDIHDSMNEIRLASIDDIEKRLAVLKDLPESSSSTDAKVNIEKNEHFSDNEEENDDEVAKKLAIRFLEEAAIDSKNKHENEEELNELDIPTPLDPSETEELPWCTICNEDAVIRCMSCGGDLFCRGCFKECHDDDEDYQRHKTKTFTAIRKNESY